MDLRVNTCTYVYARHQQFSLALSSAPQRKQAFCNLLSLVNITKTLFHYPYLYLCFAFVYLFSHATIICSGKFIRDSTSLMLLVLKQVVKLSVNICSNSIKCKLLFFLLSFFLSLSSHHITITISRVIGALFF